MKLRGAGNPNRPDKQSNTHDIHVHYVYMFKINCLYSYYFEAMLTPLFTPAKFEHIPSTMHVPWSELLQQTASIRLTEANFYLTGSER